MSYQFRTVARSDVGLVRDHNEDACLAHPQILAVADGMGGHAAGEVASSTVITTVFENLGKGFSSDWIVDTINLGSKKIANAMKKDREKQGMGTTLSLIALAGNKALVGHVGDTRIYSFFDDNLELLTQDHTYVAELVARGEITADEANYHPRRNLIMRAIDGAKSIDVDTLEIDIDLGTRFLVCSDGLSGVVSDIEIAKSLQIEDLTLAVDSLVQKAIDNGAPDNVTVVLGEVSENVSEDFILIHGADVDE